MKKVILLSLTLYSVTTYAIENKYSTVWECTAASEQTNFAISAEETREEAMASALQMCKEDLPADETCELISCVEN